MNNSNVSYKSHHYFIGKKLSKKDGLKIREIQQQIFHKNSYLDSKSKICNIYTPFLYLGYHNENIEDKLKSLLLPQFFAISEKIKPFQCALKSYIFAGQSKQFQYLALEYKTENDILNKAIIPFLKSYMDKYTGRDLSFETTPIIPLFRFDSNNMEKFLHKNQHAVINNKYVFMDIPMPSVSYNSSKKEKFIKIDSIELMRATPINIRKGKKTFNEQLQIDTLMSIPLQQPIGNDQG